jgi:mRNA interferase MazF
VRTIDKQRLREKVCHLDDDIMGNVNRALKISLAL